MAGYTPLCGWLPTLGILGKEELKLSPHTIHHTLRPAIEWHLPLEEAPFAHLSKGSGYRIIRLQN